MSSYTDYEQDPSGNPKFYGVYKAKVVSNVDPELKYRLSMIIPQVTGSELIDLVDACLPPMVEGSIDLPDTGDYVWVMFESGDISHPVWIGKGL